MTRLTRACDWRASARTAPAPPGARSGTGSVAETVRKFSLAEKRGCGAKPSRTTTGLLVDYQTITRRLPDAGEEPPPDLSAIGVVLLVGSEHTVLGQRPTHVATG